MKTKLSPSELATLLHSKVYFVFLCVANALLLFIYGFSVDNFTGRLIPVITYAFIGTLSLFLGILPIMSDFTFGSKKGFRKLLLTFSLLHSAQFIVFLILSILHFEQGY